MKLPVLRLFDFTEIVQKGCLSAWTVADWLHTWKEWLYDLFRVNQRLSGVTVSAHGGQNDLRWNETRARKNVVDAVAQLLDVKTVHFWPIQTDFNRVCGTIKEISSFDCMQVVVMESDGDEEGLCNRCDFCHERDPLDAGSTQLLRLSPLEGHHSGQPCYETRLQLLRQNYGWLVGATFRAEVR